MAASFVVSASSAMGVSFRKTCPALLTFTTSCSSSPASGAAATLGRSIETPCWRMGAVTMKMTSSTSMTSTSGVTLMSEIDPPPSDGPPPNAMTLLLQEMSIGDVQELDRERVDLGGQHAEPPG